MVYVKSFDILGVDTAQIPCIELQGVPNAATVGVVGLLGMDVTSEGSEIYVCTDVNGAVYTWKPLKDGKDGTCVVKSEINDSGELIITLSDGKTLNAGRVKGESGKDGKDGKDGDKGEDGVSVTNCRLVDGDLVVTFSNGTEKNVGKVVGTDGQNGVSIVKTELNANYEFIITLSNDTMLNLGKLPNISSEEWEFTDENDTVFLKKVYVEMLGIRVSGTWQFLGVPDESKDFEVSFTVPKIAGTFVGIRWNATNETMVYVTADGGVLTAYESGEWNDEYCKIIFDDQSITNEFYTWLTAIAIKR